MFCEQEAVLKATAGNVAYSSLSFLSSTGGPEAEGGSGGRGDLGVGELGEGVQREGGRGHFHPPAMYCATTWCFAPKGLRTMNG